jgi:hypothetical protein
MFFHFFAIVTLFLGQFTTIVVFTVALFKKIVGEET